MSLVYQGYCCCRRYILLPHPTERRRHHRRRSCRDIKKVVWVQCLIQRRKREVQTGINFLCVVNDDHDRRSKKDSRQNKDKEDRTHKKKRTEMQWKGRKERRRKRRNDKTVPNEKREREEITRLLLLLLLLIRTSLQYHKKKMKLQEKEEGKIERSPAKKWSGSGEWGKRPEEEREKEEDETGKGEVKRPDTETKKGKEELTTAKKKSEVRKRGRSVLNKRLTESTKVFVVKTRWWFCCIFLSFNDSFGLIIVIIIDVMMTCRRSRRWKRR